MIALLLVCCVGPFVRPVDAFGDPLPPHAVARLGTGRFRLERPAVAADLSPDGKVIAATEGASVTLFDASNGTLLGGIDPELAEVVGLRFSPDGRRVVAFGSGVSVIDVVRDKVEMTRDEKVTGVRQIAISGDGRYVAYAMSPARGRTSVIEVYSLRTGRVVRRVTVEDRLPTMLALTTKGDRLAAVSASGGERELKLWDVATGKELAAPKIKPRAGGVLAFSPDDRTLAVAGCGRDSALWSLDTNKRLASLGEDRAAVVTFSPDGKRVAVVGPAGVAQFDARTGKRIPLRRPGGLGRTFLTGGRVLPGGTVLAVGVSGHSICLVPDEGKARRGGHVGPVRSLAFAADGRTLESSSIDGVRSWEAEGWRPVGHIEPPEEEKDPRYGAAIVFLSPSGRYTFTLRMFEKVRVDEAGGGKKLGEVGANYSEEASPALSANEKRFAVVGTARDPEGAGYVQRVQVVELPSMRTVRSIELPFGTLPLPRVEIALSPDGSRLVASDGQTAIVFDVASGMKLGRVALAGYVARPAFSPDGRWLALPADEAVDVRDAATLETVFSLPVPKERVIPVLTFSPDSRLLAVCRESYLRPEINRADVTVFELASQRVRWMFPGRARVLTFSPDGKRLAAGIGPTAVVYDLSGLAVAKPLPEGREPWGALAADADRATAALAALSLDPSRAVALIAAELKPAEGKPRAERLVRRLVEDLADPTRRVRSELLLADGGPRLAGLLEEMGKDVDHPDAKKSLRGLIRDARAWPGEGMLRAVRAIELLERLGTSEARRLLADLAAGNPDARLTAEADSALRRMRR